MRLFRNDFKAFFLFSFVLLFFLMEVFRPEFEPGPRSALAETPSDSPPFAASFVSTRPKMVFIDPPGIFYAPDSPYDLYRIDRTWYYHYGEKWYQSERHDGSWRYLPPSRVPDLLKNLPEPYLRKEGRPLPAEAGPSKGKKGKTVRPKKKMKSSPKKISSSRPLSS